MSSILKISDIEQSRFDKWYEDHRKSCKTHSVSMYYSETGIGTAVKATCPICNQTENLTDYSSW
jgi:hypothetical protein